jgi:Flp pilus assembly protein TadD
MTLKSPLWPVLVLVAAACLGGCRTAAVPADLRLGVEATRDGRWDEAVARWTKALAADPSPAAAAAAHNNLAVAFERLGRFDEARAEYEAALERAPEDARIRENFRRFKEARKAALGAGAPKGPESAGEAEGGRR